MFLNRERDLARLERWWQSQQPELITVYGRRQVGKTELIVRFLGDKPSIYFYADRQLVSDHLRAFTDQVLLLADDPLLRIQPFSTWEAALPTSSGWLNGSEWPSSWTSFLMPSTPIPRYRAFSNGFGIARDAQRRAPTSCYAPRSGRPPSGIFTSTERSIVVARTSFGSSLSPIATPSCSFRTGPMPIA